METIVISGSRGVFDLNSAIFGGAVLVWLCVVFPLSILLLVAYWRVLEKAGYPGWGILIPFYNLYLVFKLAGRPWGWILWLLFPPVLFVLAIVAQFDIAKRFWKGVGYGFGLWLLPIVFYPLIAFGDAKYQAK